MTNSIGKAELIYNLSSICSCGYPLNESYDLINSYQEIKHLSKRSMVTKCYYSNYENIKQTLYKDDQVIVLDEISLSEDLAFYYYLEQILIKDEVIIN